MRLTTALLALLTCTLAGPVLAVDALDFSTVGIYGRDFEVCDFTNFKFFARPENYESYARMVREAHERGQFVMVGLYTYDRVTLKGPIEEYFRATDELLDALPLELVDAVFLSEENIAWNNGIEIQNQLYDHVKQRHPKLPVYQWFTPYDAPHAGVRADGWIIDPYRLGTQDFRKYLMKWLSTGLPVINCVNASPEVGDFQSSQDQVEVCREFNVPMFFYAVDSHQGSPFIWMQTDEPELATWRGWFMRVREMCHATDVSRLPLPSAQWSYGIPMEVAGGADNRFAYADDFGNTKFIDDATIDGFGALRWDGFGRRLGVLGGGAVTLTWHLWSVFEMRVPAVTLTVTPVEGAAGGAALSWSGDGNTWQEMAAGEPVPDFAGRNLWVRVRLWAEGPAGEPVLWLDDLAITGETVPPAQRVVQILPEDRRGNFAWRDDFESTRALHQAVITGGEDLQWQRGSVGIHGQDGRAIRPTLRWHFTSERPMQNVTITVESYSHRQLGAHNEIGVSLDGENVLISETTSGREDSTGRYTGTITLDLSGDERFADATELWLHVAMINTAGVATGRSNEIRLVEIAGRLAPAEAAQ
ncbi:MAG: hypothetical protein AB7Y46_16135 [Armatimonadota bacterium]